MRTEALWLAAVLTAVSAQVNLIANPSFETVIPDGDNFRAPPWTLSGASPSPNGRYVRSGSYSLGTGATARFPATATQTLETVPDTCYVCIRPPKSGKKLIKMTQGVSIWYILTPEDYAPGQVGITVDFGDLSSASINVELNQPGTYHQAVLYSRPTTGISTFKISFYNNPDTTL